MQAESLYLTEGESFLRAPMRGARFAVLGVVVFALCWLLIAPKPWAVAAEVAARVEVGEEPLLGHDVATGLWVAALGIAAAGILLLVLWKRWCRQLPGSVRPAPVPSESLARPVFWLLVCAAVGVGGAVRSSLATRGLGWEELWSVKHASLGYLEAAGEPGAESFEFVRRGWAETVWGYREPTNHPQASVASRVSQSVWRARAGAEPHAFDALAVRAPALLAGLASIVVIAVLVRRWGFPVGGVIAAFFLALHPWHMRYGTEARGYSLAVLWTMLGCLWLSKALADEGGRWRYWLLFGLNQLLLIWCLPNGFYYAAAFCVIGVAIALWRWRRWPERAAVLWRLVAVNVFAAMAFLPLFLPNVLQASRWGEIDPHAPASGGLLDALCQLAFGMDVAGGNGPGAEGIPSFQAELAASPWGAWPMVALLAAGVLVGIVRLASARPVGLLFLGGTVATAALSLLATKLPGHSFHNRDIIYAIVPFAALFGIGLAGFSRAVTTRYTLAALVGLAALGLYFYSTRDSRSLLISRPYAPFEEVAGYLDKRVAKQPGLRAIGYGFGGRMMGMYSPHTRFAKNKASLEREIIEAETASVPYVIILGYEDLNRQSPDYADGFEIIDHPGAFTESRHFPGIEPLFYFKLLEPVREEGQASPR